MTLSEALCIYIENGSNIKRAIIEISNYIADEEANFYCFSIAERNEKQLEMKIKLEKLIN